MATVSLCLTVFNDGSTLETCLSSVSDLVDEIIIVDKGSIDATKSIANIFTNNVFEINMNNNSEAKNFAFSKATGDYIMWLNPNEYLTENNRLEFTNFKKKLTVNYDAIMLKSELSYDKNGSCNQWNYSERIVKRSKNFSWQGDSHEFLVIMGSVTYSDISINKVNSNRLDNLNDTSSTYSVFEESKTPEEILSEAKQSFKDDDIHNCINLLKQYIDKNSDDVGNLIDSYLLLSECYRINIDERQRLKSLINCLESDVVNPKLYQYLGNYFYDHKQYFIAITWYKTILESKKYANPKAFDLKEYSFDAYLDLCECYKALNNNDKALKFHKKAKSLKPTDIKIIENEKYFKKELTIKDTVTNSI